MGNQRPAPTTNGLAFDRERQLAAIARDQHGAVTRAQLLGLGYSDTMVTRRLKRSLWPVAPGVYAVGHPRLSRRGRGTAALLYAGAGSALSWWTAARVWEMVAQSTDGPFHVSVPDRRTLSKVPGLMVHRPANLAPDDLATHRGVRVTTPERVLLDVLPTTPVVELSRMLEQTVVKVGRSPDDLHAWGTGLTNVAGHAKLLRALDEIAGPAVIRSELESRFRSLCQEAGLPLPHTNYRLGRWEVDAVWVDHGVAIELDSWRWHGGKWQFHQDRRKGLAISRAGYELIRLTWPQLKHDSREVVDALRFALARGAARPAPR